MKVIYVDADACPVKEEVYRVARRHGLEVVVVAKSRMRVPDDPLVRLETVGDAFDAADDWIAGRAEGGDIVVTADILLADRCLKRGAYVLGAMGKPFTEENIGDAVATREMLSELREMGQRNGPPPFRKEDRSRFLQQLDTAIHSLKRRPQPPG